MLEREAFGLLPPICLSGKWDRLLQRQPEGMSTPLTHVSHSVYLRVDRPQALMLLEPLFGGNKGSLTSVL